MKYTVEFIHLDSKGTETPTPNTNYYQFKSNADAHKKMIEIIDKLYYKGIRYAPHSERPGIKRPWNDRVSQISLWINPTKEKRLNIATLDFIKT